MSLALATWLTRVSVDEGRRGKEVGAPGLVTSISHQSHGGFRLRCRPDNHSVLPRMGRHVIVGEPRDRERL